MKTIDLEDREVAVKVLKEQLGLHVEHIEPQEGGASNIVFAAQTSDGDLVVRLARDSKRLDIFEKERWAINRAREAGIPVPEIIATGELDNQAFTILRRIVGKNALAGPDRVEVVREMGRYAAIMNSISTQGLGSQFDWTGVPQIRETERFLFRELELDHRLTILGKYGRLSLVTLDKIRAILIELYESDREATLNHGDLRLKNIILNDEAQIVAIIDWERCTSNLAPSWELAIALHDLTIDEKVALVQGYGLGEEDLMNLAPSMKALNMLHYALILEEAALREDRTVLEECRMHLSGVFDLYSFT